MRYMKAHLLFMCVLFSLYCQGQNTSCGTAIELTDSVSISDCAIRELWFKFRPSDRKYIINIVSADSSSPVDYILYKDSPDLCERINTDSVIPVGVSFHHGPHEYEGLTLEEIAGSCCCNSCEAKERFLGLKKDSLYYIRIFPRGKAVILKKDFNYVRSKKKDLFTGPIAIGKTITLENIHFYPESSRFLESSNDGLEKLLKFMEDNPRVFVEIQGHVNSPGNKNDPKDKMLSQARANAVMQFLVRKGISSSRIKAVGYGNTKMLFPVPKNEDQMKMNRRVELVVTRM